MGEESLLRFFADAPSLTEICTQNGWPDPQTLRVVVLEQGASELLCEVAFEEVIMEGSGCCADRVGCWGQYRVQLDASGSIVRADAVVGPRS